MQPLCLCNEASVSYPKHLPQVRVTEAEGDVGDVEPFGLGFARPLLITPTSCPAPCRHGNAQSLRVRGDGSQGVVLAGGETGERRKERGMEQKRVRRKRKSKDVEGWSEVVERWRERKSVREGE